MKNLLSRLVLPIVVVVFASVATTAPAKAACGVPSADDRYQQCMALPGANHLSCSTTSKLDRARDLFMCNFGGYWGEWFVSKRTANPRTPKATTMVGEPNYAPNAQQTSVVDDGPDPIGTNQ